VRVRAESERALVVEGLMRAEALDVAHFVVESLPEAYWVEPHAEYRQLNSDGVTLTQSGTEGVGATTPIWDMGIHGEGEVIGVGDSGLDVGHCFFEDAPGGTAANQNYGVDHRKVVAYRAYADGVATGLRDHGTHVVGSILGESSTPGAEGAGEMGSAYKAKVSFTDIGPGDAPGLAVPNDLVNNFFNIDYDNGARIHSNSWGANINAYTLPTQDVDEFMHEFDDMLILFAAGNSGQQGPGSIGAPATCKNCLTVGASENPPRTPNNVAVFSSQGPAVGGRFKPDLVAPGFSLLSANSNSAGDCPIVGMAGTSMATPITAGDVALIRQYLREGYFPTGTKNGGPGVLPSGAMMKAMAIHSSQPLTGTYQDGALTPPPSQVQGFGRVQLDRVLFSASGGKTPGDRLLMVDDDTRPLTAGQEHTYTIPTGGVDPILGNELKVTLVWTDVPAQPASQNPLVNNLDLIVTVNGVESRGNGQIDTINTVEQVVTTVPAGATATIAVRGTGITQGAQKYALVVTGPLQVTSPPPAFPKPPPPSPPRAPGSPLGDAVALGVALPLLFLAVGAGGCFLCRRNTSAAGGAAMAAGAGGAAGAVLKRGSTRTTLLPEGWEMLRDPSSGAPYYLNKTTGATQWNPPPPPEVSLPPPWTSVLDPASGRTYYYNGSNGETSWTRPTK